VRTILAACALLSGCALVSPQPKEPPLGPGEVASARAAEDSVYVGKSTKAAVRAALGQATEVDFESGYAIWVYREPARKEPPSPGAELVLLFDPSGLLTRTRVR
jgi:hypothetical protein